MDYAFLPGATDWEMACRAAMESRPSTSVLPAYATSVPGLQNVSDFMAVINALPAGADNLLIFGHGFHGDYFEVALDAAHRTRLGNKKAVTYYEDLRLAESSGTIAPAPTSLSPGGAIHLKGCSVGAQPKYLTAFKQALGGFMRVTAPKHFHIFTDLESGEGVFEYFHKRYVVYRKTLGVDGNKPIGSTNLGISATQLVDEFDSQKFTLVDSTTPIPKAWWEEFIGTLPVPLLSGAKELGNFKLHDRIGMLKHVHFEPEYGPRGFYKLPIALIHDSSNDYEHTVSGFRAKYPTAVPPDEEIHPARDEDLEILRQELPSDPRFTTGHPYPLWERYGEPDLEQWLTKRNWKTVYDDTSDAMVMGGWRHAFAIRLPACRSRDKDFVIQKFNYYPAASGRSFASHLSETDSELFLTV